MIVSGQVTTVPHQKTCLCISKWQKAFTIFMAVLFAAEETSKEEAAGLAARILSIYSLTGQSLCLKAFHLDLKSDSINSVCFKSPPTQQEVALSRMWKSPNNYLEFI